MKNKKTLSTFTSFLILMAAAFWAFPVIANANPAKNEALDLQGNLFQLRHAYYGDVAPGGSLATPETPVLVLDVSPVGGDCRHEIVPRSLGWESDTEEHLFLDMNTGSIYVLWIVKGMGTDEVRLSVYQSSTWTSEYRLSDPISASRQNLDTVFSRQSVQSTTAVAAGSSASQPFPMILQLVWWEVSTGGVAGTRFVPVFINRDGTINESSALAYDPAAGVGGGPACSGALPDAAAFPTITKEDITLSHLSLFSAASCQFLVIPVQFIVSGDDQGRTNRFIPFIGVTFAVALPSSTSAVGNGSRFGVSSSGSFITGYSASLSWVDSDGFHYQFYNPIGETPAWGDPLRINLAGEMTVDKARGLVQEILDTK